MKPLYLLKLRTWSSWLCIVLLLGVSNTGLAQLFLQPFNSGNPVTQYVAAGGQPNKFNSVLKSGSGTSFTAISNMLSFTRSSGSATFSRSTDLSPVPSTMIYKLDLSVVCASGTNNVAQFKVGDGFSATNTPELNSSTWGRFGIDYFGTDQFRVRNLSSGTVAGPYSGTQSLMWVLNNGSSTITYTGANGSPETLAADKMDLWVGTTRVMDEMAATTPSLNLADLKFVINAGNGTINIDNIDINYAVGTVVCPSDPLAANNDLDECSAFVTMGAPSVTNACISPITLTNDYNGTDDASDIYAVGTTLVNWTITDACGNVSNCTQTVVVNDAQNPVFAPISNFTANTSAPSCSYTVNGGEFDPTVTDNCYIANLSYTLSGATTGSGSSSLDGVALNFGATTVTWTAVDGNSNTVVASAYSITVSDNDAPVISGCPSNIVQQRSCAGPVSWTPPTALDNCSAVTTTSNFNSGDNFPVGTTEVKYIFTDAAGNKDSCSFNVVINQLSAAHTASNYNGFNISCNGTNDGNIDLAVANNSGALTYSWSGPGGFSAATEDISGLVAGAYTVTITDGPCSITYNVTLTEPAALSVTPSMTPATCAGATDGTITLGITGGVSPYTYSLNGGPDLPYTGTITGVVPNNYTITVKDVNDCSINTGILVASPPAIVMGATTNSGPVGHGGTLTLNTSATGGTGTLSYAWTGSTTAVCPTASTASGASANLNGVTRCESGLWTVVATDVNGCTATGTTTAIVYHTSLYVDDANNGSDVYTGTSVAGSDAAAGTSDAPFATLPFAASIAQATDTIFIDAATYALTNTLYLNNPVKVIGAGSASVIDISAIGSSSWGINPNANNITLSDFAITGFNANGGYAIQNTLSISGLTLSNLSATGTKRTPFNFNGLLNSSLSNLSASGTTAGFGIAISGASSGITINGLTTSSNAWGDAALIEWPSASGINPTNIEFQGTLNLSAGTGAINAQPGAGSISISTTDNTDALYNGAADVRVPAAFNHVVYSKRVIDNLKNYSITDGQTNAVNIAQFLVAQIAPGNWTNTTIRNYETGHWTVAPTLYMQDAVDQSTAGHIIDVLAGSYTEDVNINKAVSVIGAGYATTTVSGPIGGSNSTFVIAAGGVVLDGFSITRVGNNVAQWNLALNTAGVSAQSQGNYGEIRNCSIYGNRTGIDINNSNGNNIHNNIIDNNRTGLIFRNQTDNTNVSENFITNNWTAGVLFLDGSGGSNSPVQTAANSTFNNNNLSGNWYGDIVDRQSGGSLPAPGTNIKNFECNWFGATSNPVTSILNSTEPGYAAQIPVVYGGSAVAPGGQPNILGTASANIDYVTWLVNGTDNSGNAGFQPVGSSCTGAPVTVVLASQTNVDCNGNSTGALDITPGGGNGSYTFSWTGGATTEDISGLAAGTYTVIVTDGLGSTATASWTITEPAVLTISASSNTPVYAGAAVNFSSTPTGGTGPYTYTWTPGGSMVSSTVEDPTITVASVSDNGTYTVSIIDANGCTASATTALIVYGTNLYVNDNNLSGDVFTTAVGNNANAGTTSAPFRDINYAISIAQAGNIIRVDAGTYAENLIVDKGVQLLGPNETVDPCSGTRVGEAVLTTAVSDITGATAYSIVDVQASNVTIKGFTIDGDNTSITTGKTSTTAADIDIALGVTRYYPGNNTVVSNNIIKNLSYFGVELYEYPGSTPSAGNEVTNNQILDLGTYDNTSGIAFWGGGVLLYNNQYAKVENNCMSNVRLGVQTGNFHLANPGTSVYQSISNNTISSRRAGIFHNLHYGTASGFTLANNSLTTIDNTNESGWRGILFGSLSVPSTASANTINGTGSTRTNVEGMNVWNCQTAPNITGGTISNVKLGINVNNFEGYNSNANNTTATINGVSISASDAGIKVNDNNSNTNGATVSAVISGNTQINTPSIGLWLNGGSASASFSGPMAAAFTGQTTYIDQTNNGTDAPSANMDATNVSFDGVTGGAATLAQNFAIVDKINHKVDNSDLGLVRVKATHLFVTTNSYIIPATAIASVQRGIDAATSGDVVNVNNGTFVENVNLNKGVTVTGQGPASTILNPSTSCTGTGVAITAANAKLMNMQVTSFQKGITVASANNEIRNVESVSNCIYGVELFTGTSTLKIVESKLNSNQVGLRTGSAVQVNGLTIDSSEVIGNIQGIYTTANSGGTAVFDNISIKNSAFINNLQKGMYFEVLSNAVIDNISMDNCGTDASYGFNNGIDINLKYNNYSNIILENSSITNCGVYGTASNVEFPSAVCVKARDDAPSYSGVPSTLTNLTIRNNFISGPVNGIRLGESGKINNTPNNALINENDLGAAFSNKAIIDRIVAPVNGECNWFGSTAAASVAGKITVAAGSVDYTSWLVNGGDNFPAIGGFQPVPGSCIGSPILFVSAIATPQYCAALGTIAVTFSGGTAPYDVAWSGGGLTSGVSSPYTITGLTPGLYNITVTDFNGSTATGSATVGTEFIVNTRTSASYAAIQPAINAALAGDTITVCSGTYTETIDINKALVLQGANAGIPGTGVRGTEVTLLNCSIDINNGGNTVIDGFRILRTDALVIDQVQLDGSGINTVQNCIFERNGSATGTFARAMTTSAGGGVKNILNNKITGDISGGLFSGHKSWNNAIYINGGAAIVNLTGNTIMNCRTAVSIDDYSSSLNIAGNTLNNNGTQIGLGGVSPTLGSFVMGANDFINNAASTMVNCSNVDQSFRLDITSSTLNGVSFASLSNASLFDVEARMAHKEVSASKKGKVTYVANTQYVNNFTVPVTKIDKIQNSVKYAEVGNIINLQEGTYNQRVVVDKNNLTLQGITNVKASYIISGTGLLPNGGGAGSQSGIVLNTGITGTTIQNLTVQDFTGVNGNSDGGIYGLLSNNNTAVTNVALLNNPTASGFYANGPVDNVSVTNSQVDNNGSGARGIVIWNGLKTNINFSNNTLSNNTCCGIELSDGDASAVTVTNNQINIGNGDNAIGLVGLNPSVGANLIDGNIITGGGRFGIEIKNPAGGVTVSNNNVSLTTINADQRDRAGIAVFRRGLTGANVDVPNGVTVTGNTVDGYTQASVDEGFGIVIEGTQHTVSGNTVNNCEVGIQQQGGAHPNANYPGDGDQAVGASANYFGRGNSPLACGNTISSNTFSGNGTDTRNVIGGGIYGLVTNTNTGEYFCNIQAAIDDAQTLSGHTLNVAAATHTGSVNITKSLTLNGANAGVSACGTRSAETVIQDGAFNLAANGITLNGFEFTGTGAQIRSDAALATWSNINILNNRIHSTTASQPILHAFGFGGGVGTTNWTINGNKIDNILAANATAIAIFNITGVTITNNCIQHANASFIGRRGINADGLQNANIDDNTIDLGDAVPSELVSQPSPWAVQISMSDRIASNINIRRNTIGGAYRGIMTLSQRSVSSLNIERNIIGPVSVGIDLNTGAATPVVALPVQSAINVYQNIITTITPDVGGIGSSLRLRNLHNAHANGPVSFTGVTVNENNFITPPADSAIRVESGLALSSSNATCNWYGSISGTVVAAKVSAAINASPWLISGTDDDGATIGFQPVPLSCLGSFITLSATQVNVDCNGNATGSIDLSLSGGTAPYTYSWSNGASSEDISGLVAGAYTVNVTDTYGTGATLIVTITEPNVLVASIGSVVNVSCNGGNNGSATASETGGTSPYTYAWSNGQSTAAASGLTAGTYTVVITDANGCTDDQTVMITEPNVLVASIGSVVNVSCNGGNNGSATASETGGTSPYTYAWSNGQSTAAASGLTAGTYTVVITDANGCTDDQTVTITEPNVLVASIGSVVNVSCNGGNNGSATASETGGTSPYTYAWSNGQSTAAASGLTAGTYTVVITDANGCTDDQTVTITEPNVLVASIGSVVNVSCNGGNNGSATASETGGTSPYTYAWSNGQSTAAASGLTAGTYTVVITDANGCTDDQTVTITEPNVLVASIGSVVNVSCNGGNNGSATASETGGTSPYTYAWSNGQSTAAASGLTAGTYTVVITDANGCTDDQTVTITEPNVLVASIGSVVNVSCNGGNNGSATASETGGTSPYTYAWSNGQSTAAASGLTAGTYTVVITDANGCTDDQTVTITEPNVLVASIGSVVNVSCNGGNNGSATASETGGTSPYTYAWSNGQSTAAASGLTAGTYTVVITDANGCTDDQTVTITEPNVLVASIGSVVNVSCNGGNNGSATASETGGTSPYTYAWSNGQSTAAASGLTAGTYTVVITDANGCTDDQTVTITEPNVLVASIGSVVNVSCNGGNNGSATASETGGTSPYTYAWSNGQSTAAASGLTAGTYTVVITDANGCTDDQTVTITEPNVLVASIGSVVNVSCNGGNNGSATASETGGTSPYTYAWSNGQSTAAASGLTAGTYTVVITDANGCTDDQTVTITEPNVLVASIGSVVNVSCNGGNNGSALASAVGGTGIYSYAWSNGDLTAATTGLIAGNYTVTVTDANGCTDEETVTITEPSAVTASNAGQSNVTCNGGTNGSVTVLGGGGTPGYTYLWDGGQTTSARNGLSAGTYTVTVSDANGCTAVEVVIITEPSAIIVTPSVTNVTCNGNSNGAISLGVSGGTPGYTYLWNGGQTTSSRSGLAAGSYTVTVTDANLCTMMSIITVTQPAAIAVNPTVTNVSCNGAGNGSITTNVSGGTSPYTYLWNGGLTTPNRTGLTPGTYTVTVTDANGCTAVSTNSITQPAILNLSTSRTNVSCNGGSNGTANAAASGGTSPYTFSWTGPGGFTSTSQNLTGLIAGVYTAIVTDVNGCTKSTLVFLTQPAAPISASFNNVPGTSTVIAAGGTPGYTYRWNTGATTVSIPAITGTTYTVTVTDSRGCKGTFSTVGVRVAGVDPSADLDVNVYPNPTAGQINVELDANESDVLRISLLDLSGRLIFTDVRYAAVGINKISYDFTQYAGGMYLLSIERNDVKGVVRVIVE